MEEIVKSLADTGELKSTLDIPDAIGPVEVRVDLRSRQTFTSVAFAAPKEGTQRRRFGWLMRQLKEGPDDLRIEAAFPNARVQNLRPWQPPAPKVHSSPEPSEVAGAGQAPIAPDADGQHLSVGPGPSRSPLRSPDAPVESDDDKAQDGSDEDSARKDARRQ